MTDTASVPPRGTILTAMFTDIVDSTRLKNEMPADTAVGRDEAYRVTIKQPHDERLLRLVKSKGGVEADSNGDGYLSEAEVYKYRSNQYTSNGKPVPTELFTRMSQAKD